MSAESPLVGVINAGSSSLKLSVFEGERRLLSGQVEGIGTSPKMKLKDVSGILVSGPDLARTPPQSPAEALLMLLPWLRDWMGGRTLAGLGHRIVHGGPRHDRPERITWPLLDELGTFAPLAPLHQPYNLAPARAALEQVPSLPQVACFDTAYHRTVPMVSQVYALPIALADEGIHRYGFHGLSYEYISSVLINAAPAIAGGRLVVAHLGNGASLCAMHAGRSIATTMGFSALDGLPMGTRCGELDPAVVLYLLQQKGMDPVAVEDLLYRRSGMLGLSGMSSDFRDLLASPEPRAKFAVNVFVHRVVRGIGSLAAALGGIDGIIFTAGVGENAATIRAAVCEGCAWLGVELDPDANAVHGSCITTPRSRVSAHVIPTDENQMIARHTRSVLAV